MMSISPSSGQRDSGGIDNVQMAGQLPVPQGSLARTSMNPNRQLALSRVIRRADEYRWPLQSFMPRVDRSSLRAVNTRKPFSTREFSTRAFA
jgi:hypothetical protein